MKSAHCLVKNKPEYPWGAIISGIKSQGYDLTGGTLPVDLLVTWTPWNNSIAHRAGENQKKLNLDWVVFENGYLPASNGTRYYCAGLNGFNGYGDHRVRDVGTSRLKELGIDIKDWGPKGDYILVVSQFGHRDTRYSMPVDWPDTVIKELRKFTDRPIIFKVKAGRLRAPSSLYEGISIVGPDEPLSPLIKGAWAVVTWNSKAAVEAIVEGVPALVEAPRGIAKFMTTPIEEIENPIEPDRLTFLKWVAHTQWNQHEITNGAPFRQLLK